MTILKPVFILLLLCASLELCAKKKVQDYPRAEIKVSYNYHEKFLRGWDGVVDQDITMLLLANPQKSKFYCPATEFKDSLMSTPSGQAVAKKIMKGKPFGSDCRNLAKIAKRFLKALKEIL